jgi:dihydroxy-acid dehydratase
MDPRNPEKQDEPEEPRYLDFRHLPEGAMRDGKPALNRYSSTLTNGHDFPGAQVQQAFSAPSARNSSLRECVIT